MRVRCAATTPSSPPSCFSACSRGTSACGASTASPTAPRPRRGAPDASSTASCAPLALETGHEPHGDCAFDAVCADRRAISQREADQAATGLKQALAAAQLAEARVRQSELNLSYASVIAPIAGITGRAQQSIGSLVTPGTDSSLLTTLTQADPIWVRFALSETEYARLRGFDLKNPEVKVELPDGSRYPEPGRLNFSSSSVDSNLGTVQMRAELPNPRLQLLPGQYVRVQVVAGTQQALVVPQSAVMQNEGGRFVWIVEAEGKAAQRQIKVGSWVGDDWVVLDGLKAGDTVIVDNLLRLRPGTAVKLQGKG